MIKALKIIGIEIKARGLVVINEKSIQGGPLVKEPVKALGVFSGATITSSNICWNIPVMAPNIGMINVISINNNLYKMFIVVELI